MDIWNCCQLVATVPEYPSETYLCVYLLHTVVDHAMCSQQEKTVRGRSLSFSLSLPLSLSLSEAMTFCWPWPQYQPLEWRCFAIRTFAVGLMGKNCGLSSLSPGHLTSFGVCKMFRSTEYLYSYSVPYTTKDPEAYS